MSEPAQADAYFKAINGLRRAKHTAYFWAAFSAVAGVIAITSAISHIGTCP